MIHSLRKILLALLISLAVLAFAGCSLFPTTAATTATTATMPSTSSTAELTTVTAVTTTTPITQTTTGAVTNVGIVLSGVWQNVYEYGEAFNPAGLIVTLVKSDGSETAVTEYFVLGYSPTVLGFQTVRIRHLGLEASFPVYVRESSIAVDVALELTLPHKLVYEPGDLADWTGLVVSVVKSDGERIVVSNSTYVVSGFTSTTPGLVTISVTYDELVATFPIYVADPAAGGVYLTVTAPTKTVYDAGDPLDLAGMQVALAATGEPSIVLTSGEYAVDAPDISAPGTYEVVITALGLTDSFFVTVNATVLDLIPYYDDAEGLTGNALLLALRDIVTTGFTGITYGDARYILDDSDADPNHAGYIIEFYTGQSRNGTWDNGVTWNREHVFPQSKLGVDVDNAYIGVGSDLFNLTPADPSINSSRGNKWFSTVTNTYSYLPTRTAIHGDIARILLYMTVRYDYLELIELGPSQDPALYQFGDLSTLLAWHLADPVDDFERHRNEVIYSYQDNRNPFIDYPDFVDMIWGQA